MSFGPPQAVCTYAASLTSGLFGVAGGHVVGVYLHGSATLGGWRAEVSDVDVLVVVDGHRRVPTAALAEAVAATAPACPGTGLELSVVTRAAAASPAPPWPFVVHLATSGSDRRIVLGEGHPGDRDLVLHYVACRTCGWPASGPPPGEVFGPVARPAVLEALAAELAWGLEYASAPYAVLNACRALVYLRENRIVGKIAGGEWALDKGIGPSEGVRGALHAQAGGTRAASLTDADVAFVQDVVRRLSQSQ